MRRGGGLGLAERRPLIRCLDPRTGQFANDERQTRGVQVLADIADEVGQPLAVFGIFIPFLVPQARVNTKAPFP